MLALERREAILRMIRESGKVTIAELVALFHVSAETIRKDLMFLEADGELRRTHGGAVSGTRSTEFPPLQLRLRDRMEQKEELCRFALSYIKEGDLIAIDTGSTAAVLARLINGAFHTLTVVTHSLDVCRILSSNPGIRVILCGGIYDRAESAFRGYMTEEAIGQIYTQKAFIFPSGILKDIGITDYAEDFIPIQRAYLSHTEQAFILATSERFDTAARFAICSADTDYIYVTDSGLDAETERAYSGYTIIRRSKS